MKTTQSEIQKARELAGKATPGRWEIKSEQDSFDRWWIYGVFSQHGVKHTYNADAATKNNSYSDIIAEPAITPAEEFQDSAKNMEFIAHHNPEFILKLLDDLEALQNRVKDADEQLDFYGKIDNWTGPVFIPNDGTSENHCAHGKRAREYKKRWLE